MSPKWGLRLLPVLLIGMLCFWMRPDGKRFPVTLDTGQTVYARVLSHWHRTVALVSPSDAMTWNDIPNAPSGDMVIPADIRHRGLRYHVVGVDSCAFHNCNKLTHVTFPEGLERIGFRAFSSCNLLSDTLFIPRSLKRIESNAFADCYTLTTLVWRAQNCSTGTGEFAENSFFYRCNSLKKAIVDDGVEQLPTNVFYPMEYLEEIELPNTLRRLPMNFADESYSLSSIRLPDSLQNISHGAFYGSGITRIVIPDRTETIGTYSFSYCRKLREVEIGSGVKRIENYAFNESNALETMTVRCMEPPSMLPNSLYGIPDNAVLYVPAESVEKYRKHEVWGKFKRIEPIAN